MREAINLASASREELVNAVKTVEFSSVTQTTASVSGNVITDNGSNIIERGICYGTNSNPTVSGPKKVFNTAALGNYICTLDNLSPSTTYYARAYATNSIGTKYGEEITLNTAQAVATLAATTPVSAIGSTTATSGGNITYNGGATVTVSGVVWSTTSSPTIDLSTKTVDGSGSGTFTSSITGLSPGIIYYVRAYATNSNRTDIQR